MFRRCCVEASSSAPEDWNTLPLSSLSCTATHPSILEPFTPLSPTHSGAPETVGFALRSDAAAYGRRSTWGALTWMKLTGSEDRGSRMMLNGVDGTPLSAAGIGRVSLKVYHTTNRLGSRVTRTMATAAGPRISPAKTPMTMSRVKSTVGAAPPAGSSCRRHKVRHTASLRTTNRLGVRILEVVPAAMVTNGSGTPLGTWAAAGAGA